MAPEFVKVLDHHRALVATRLKIVNLYQITVWSKDPDAYDLLCKSYPV